MRAKDIYNKVMGWNRKEQNIAVTGQHQMPVGALESKSAADEGREGVHKALDALIEIKENSKPISLERDRIDTIKSKVMQNQPAAMPYNRSWSKKEIICSLKGEIKFEDAKKRQKIKKGYIRHYSNYFSDLKGAQLEIKPKVISRIVSNKVNILRHFKEADKNEHG